ERAAMEDLRGRLASWDGPRDDESLQTMVFAVGKEHGFEPLRAWFKALYEVLLGASDGPRFGGFVALYGVEETVALLDRGLRGDLVA
ncbi:MAG: lysine--tRNA ligase, partial [Pseudorhodobacter sp.]|nr:lysine--tRNA ligase [Pseudorhodobacter sp.]